MIDTGSDLRRLPSVGLQFGLGTDTLGGIKDKMCLATPMGC
jgi:hypothetical protein